MGCQNLFVLDPVRVLVFLKHLNSANVEIESEIFMDDAAFYEIDKRQNDRVKTQPAVSSPRRGVWLTANFAGPVSLRGAELKAYRARLSGGNHLLRASVCTALELFHFIIALKLPPSKADRQQQQQRQQHSGPCHPRTAGGETFPSCSEFLILSGKRFMSIQTAGAVSRSLCKGGRATLGSPMAVFVTITR